MTVTRDRVRRAFGHARDYDAHARIQRDVARKLAARIAALGLPDAPRVLEIGCGTGFLTQALLDERLSGAWLVTDIAPEMVDRCRARVAGQAALTFDVLDGEHGELPAGPFDLICSSLAIQWFDDAPAALRRLAGLLAPGGHLMVTTLGPATFAQWGAAHAAEGLEPGTPPFAPAEVFAALPTAEVKQETITERYESARHFLQALKAIGAGTPNAAHRPLAPATLRRVLGRFDQSGCEVDYEVVTCHLRRDR
ncbi:bifunctional biotin synthesis protein BioCD [Novosphingobium sp. Rr 2-17]|uniref:methyltransferase n=1 Tax=Novosphingobium sp. Rr 2-17 TaxID=555793 RepID=UPI000269916C|nr:methyltransferase [Novosphingobium sp. Rr 2-17]EIZ80958.1 bifunctional biotin synthesis protein BioCD [Novosphingobium sp. Rr 2-17]